MIEEATKNARKAAENLPKIQEANWEKLKAPRKVSLLFPTEKNTPISKIFVWFLPLLITED